MTNAKRDLEEFSKSGGASLEFAKQQAQKMLMDIAAKSMGTEQAARAEAVARGAGEEREGREGRQEEGQVARLQAFRHEALDRRSGVFRFRHAG